jgi:hypothetical protein
LIRFAVKILFVLMVLVTFLGIADVVYVVYKKAFYPPPLRFLF